MSYWFTSDAGVVTSAKPTKDEFGGHREKHKSLDDAPAAVRQFIENNMLAISAVTDKQPT